MIVKLSDILERSSWDGSGLFVSSSSSLGNDALYLILLFAAALCQWWTLDRTWTALLIASLTAYGGPLGTYPLSYNVLFVCLHVDSRDHVLGFGVCFCVFGFICVGCACEAELPFVAAHVWTYLPDVAHYHPLEGDSVTAQILRAFFDLANRWTDSDNNNSNSSLYEWAAISYLSAPCYFAVAMDAIALGRWFDAQEANNDRQ